MTRVLAIIVGLSVGIGGCAHESSRGLPAPEAHRSVVVVPDEAQFGPRVDDQPSEVVVRSTPTRQVAQARSLLA